MNKVIDKGFRSCRFVSTIVKHPVHEASEVLNKHVMGVWSSNFTVAFFVSFNVTVFVPDIEGIQNQVICL